MMPVVKKYLPYLAALTYSSIFGFSFLFTKEGLTLIPTYKLLGYRFGLAALVLTILWLTGFIKLHFKGKEMGLLIVLSVIQPFLYFIFETQGINHTTSSEAGLMISLIPVVVTILATLFLGEKPSKIQLVFIITSVLGVIFIMVMKGALNVEKHYTGFLYLGGAVLMAGIYNILSRLLSLKFKPVEITFIMMWSGAVFFNLISIIKYGGVTKDYLAPLLNRGALITIIYLGVFSSIVAFFMLNYTLSKLEAHQAAVFANLTTIISILAGVIIRGESFYWFQIVGSLMIITGVWGTNYYGRIQKKAEELPG